jgi:hypothetical protein
MRREFKSKRPGATTRITSRSGEVPHVIWENKGCEKEGERSIHLGP